MVDSFQTPDHIDVLTNRFVKLSSVIFRALKMRGWWKARESNTKPLKCFLNYYSYSNGTKHMQNEEKRAFLYEITTMSLFYADIP